MTSSVYGMASTYRYHCFLPKPMAANASCTPIRQTAATTRSNSGVLKNSSTTASTTRPMAAVRIRVFIGQDSFHGRSHCRLPHRPPQPPRVKRAGRQTAGQTDAVRPDGSAQKKPPAPAAAGGKAIRCLLPVYQIPMRRPAHTCRPMRRKTAASAAQRPRRLPAETERVTPP